MQLQIMLDLIQEHVFHLYNFRLHFLNLYIFFLYNVISNSLGKVSMKEMENSCVENKSIGNANFS